MLQIIKQNIIDSLPDVHVDGLLEDENRYVNDWIKYVLQRAKNDNNSGEVGVILDMTNWQNYDAVLGSERHVRFNTSQMKKWLKAGNDNLILIHNHPSNSIFSSRDIINFCKTKAINTLIVVGNLGTVYVLQKKIAFDNAILINMYSDAMDNKDGAMSRTEILETLLINHSDEIGIRYQREEIPC